MKKRNLVVLAFIILIFVIQTDFLSANENTTNAITFDITPVRKNAGIIFEVEDYLSIGEEVKIISKEMSWFKVLYSENKVGFIYEKSLLIKDEFLVNDYNPIKENFEKISEHSTSFDTLDIDRTFNLELSAFKTSGFVKKGEAFSFNRKTGNSSRTSSGWRYAGTITNGKNTVGVGGGICQISSSIYMAVKNSNILDVTERHHHSAKVPYASWEEEAMINYPTNDLKFVNNSNFDVYIQTDVNLSSGILTTSIYKVE